MILDEFLFDYTCVHNLSMDMDMDMDLEIDFTGERLTKIIMNLGFVGKCFFMVWFLNAECIEVLYCEVLLAFSV